MSNFCPSVSSRILKIVNDFYLERAIEKFSALEASMDFFVDSYGFNENFELCLDPYKTKSLTESYFFDVVKYKDYHFNPKDENLNPFDLDFTKAVHKKKISQNKAASLTAKWILKYMPIQIFADCEYELSQNESKLISSINAWFALHEALSIMGKDLSTLDPKLEEELIYHFMYRQFDERHFFTILGSINGTFSDD